MSVNHDYTPHGRNNPCPICSSTSNKCKTRKDGLLTLCMEGDSERAAPSGYKFVKMSKGDLWGVFAIDDGSRDDADRRQWLEEIQRRNQEKIDQELRHSATAMSAAVRDRYYRQMLDELTLHPDDRANLLSRGLSDADIERHGYKSVEPRQKLSKVYPYNLPGVSSVFGSGGRSLTNKARGFLCPVKNKDGQIVAFQIRSRDKGNGAKYPWLSTESNSARLETGELPIHIAIPVSFDPSRFGVIGFCEGFLKPQIAADRLGMVVIGAAGGNFINASQQLKDFVTPGVTPLLLADGGALANNQVMRQYRGLSELVDGLQVLWWGQYTKADGDIDEISADRLRAAVSIPWHKYSAMVPRDPSTGVIQVDARWLSDAMGEINPAGAKLLTIKSSMGSGKSHWAKAYLEQFDAPKYAITYRRSLETSQAVDLGIPTVDERNTLVEYESQDVVNEIYSKGFAICIHSLHEKGKGRFEAEETKPGIVYIDEVVGVLRDLVFSNKVQRDLVLPAFASFLKRCSEAGHQIIIMDANLTHFEVELIRQLAEIDNTDVLSIENCYKPWNGKEVRWGDNLLIMSELRARLAAGANGARLLVTTSGASPTSLYGTKAIEDVARANKWSYLRVDAESQSLNPDAKYLRDLMQTGDKDALAQFLEKFDLLIISPVIESGFSLDMKDFFEAQYSFCAGNIQVQNASQQLLRLRDVNVPIFLGLPEKGSASSRIGNGAEDPDKLYEGERKKASINWASLEVDQSPEAFKSYWRQVGAMINRGVKTFNLEVQRILMESGCNVARLTTTLDKAARQTLKERLHLYAVARGTAHAKAVAAAQDIAEDRAVSIQANGPRNFPEHLSSEKFRLSQKAKGLPVSDTLCLADQLDSRLLTKAYLFAMANNFVAEEKPESQPKFLPDANRVSVKHKLQAIREAGLLDITKMNGSLVGASELQNVADKIINATDDLKVLLGLKLDDGWTVTQRINYLFHELFGFRPLAYHKKMGPRGASERKYKITIPEILQSEQALKPLQDVLTEVFGTAPETESSATKRLNRELAKLSPDELAERMEQMVAEEHAAMIAASAPCGRTKGGQKILPKGAAKKALSALVLPYVLNKWADQELDGTKAYLEIQKNKPEIQALEKAFQGTDDQPKVAKKRGRPRKGKEKVLEPVTIAEKDYFNEPEPELPSSVDGITVDDCVKFNLDWMSDAQRKEFLRDGDTPKHGETGIVRGLVNRNCFGWETYLIVEFDSGKTLETLSVFLQALEITT